MAERAHVWFKMCHCPTNATKSYLVPGNFDDDCLECSPGEEVVEQLIPMVAEQTWSNYFAIVLQMFNIAQLVSDQWSVNFVGQ